MLKAHKRKTRRTSGGLASARSVSPRPSLGGQGEAGRRSSGLGQEQQQQQQQQQTRAKTAPSSPLSNPADPSSASSSAQANWDHKPAPSSQQELPRDSSGDGDGSSSSGGSSSGSGGGGGRSKSSGPGRQGRGASAAPATIEPTMGSIFTEWFQKLFAPSDDSKGGARNSGTGSAPSSSSSPPGAGGAGAGGGGRGGGGAGAASAGARAGSQKASPEADGVRSNKTSVATSDTRPQSPSGGQASSPASAAAKAAASASAQQQQQQQQAGAGVSAAAHTSGGVAREGSYFPASSGASAGEQQILPGAAAEGSAPVSIPATGKNLEGGGGDGASPAGQQQQQQASVSPRFLGIFSRGGGTSGGAGTSNKSGDGGSSGGAGAGSGVDGNPDSSATAGGAASSAPVTAGGAVGVPASAPASAPVEAPSFGGGQGPQQQKQPPPPQGASVEQQPQQAQGADAGTAAAAGTGSGAGGAAAAAAGAGSEEERAKASALLLRENGSGGGSGSRSSSPQRAAALSVGSDDGEEENLYTAGTHQGARPSIDDFSSLRVLGKGSYGKVVLVRRKSTGVLYAMKILKKGDVVRKRQVERTKIERRVLGNVEHPFLMRLHYAFQTDNKLYLVLDYCPGGELFFHLSRYKRFPEGVVRFYAAELVLALKHLHDNNIIYRDIKPENILLDADGHIKLGDFGLAKDNVTDSTFGAQSVCGTPEYMAPEVINKAGHGTAVDWWGLGMLMYEMLTGLPPWYTKDRQKLFERLRGAPLVIPKNVSAPSASIIGGLLTRNPSKRLGTLGALQVMNHEFFRGLDWAALLAKRIPAPLNPCRNQRQGSESTHNFDPQFTRMPIDTMALGGGIVSPGPDGHFDGFTYEIPGVILEDDR